ncbi:unnamed protein product [Rotaria sordida]|uniref:Uncharacterized protein n=1 Tax=Rotaria sordida TaxID=392033 RepID=A0A814GUY9_9BILA|nr:unnamed protein product [Rotaria sordida]CAF1074470.1 unnamed protein product [Rotaria sordida]
MPIYFPGIANVSLAATVKRPIKTFELSFNMNRTVNGLTLPIKCYMMYGVSLGSCSYNGARLCQIMNDSLLENLG